MILQIAAAIITYTIILCPHHIQSEHTKREYETYIFEEGRGIQTLTMMYAENDEDGKELVKRILSSITQIEKEND